MGDNMNNEAIPWAKSIKQGLLSMIVNQRALRHIAFNLLLKEAKRRRMKQGDRGSEDTYYLIRAILKTVNKILDRGVATATKDCLSQVFIQDIFLEMNSGIKEKFNQEYGRYPPAFILICPTQNCNLSCIGCYTNSGGKGETLERDVVDRIITEAGSLWGARLIVLSGGEPLMYEPLLSLAAKHNNKLFLMYTNGTLIDQKMAKRLSEVGNIFPAISVEGYEKETDERRGEGTHKKILQAFANLKEVGVPYGISVTATRNNADIFATDEFYDFYFEKHGVIMEWNFLYMPVGRGPTVSRQPTPLQRLNIRKQKLKMERERDYFIGDFWNDGPACVGCFAAGRQGGYFNITGSGDCTACGFQPYAVANINEVFQQGGDLNTVLESEFFKAIRQWQDEYAYKKAPEEMGDLLRMCPIRDHYKEYFELLKKHKPRPIFAPAAEVLEDEDYQRGMIRYDEELEALTTPIWEQQYKTEESN